MEKNNQNQKIEEIVLDNMNDFLCVVFDSNNNIIFPTDSKLLKRYSKIIQCATNVEGIYKIDSTDEWFELYYKETMYNGEPISLKYFRNISKFKRLENEFKTDFTGISNRKSANIKIDEYLKYALDNDEEFCVMLSDIDYFKKINDAYGHFFGDTVLKNIGDLINQNIRSNPKREKDIAGRFGGDEFFGLIKNISLEESLVWKEKAENKVKEFVHVSKDKSIAITGVSMSIGLYHVNHEEILRLKNSGLKIDDIRKYIFDKSDESLYKQKSENHKALGEIKNNKKL